MLDALSIAPRKRLSTMKRLTSVIASAFVFGIVATPILATGDLMCTYGGEGDFLEAEPRAHGLPVGEVVVDDYCFRLEFV